MEVTSEERNKGGDRVGVGGGGRGRRMSEENGARRGGRENTGRRLEGGRVMVLAAVWRGKTAPCDTTQETDHMVGLPVWCHPSVCLSVCVQSFSKADSEGAPEGNEMKERKKK